MTYPPDSQGPPSSGWSSPTNGENPPAGGWGNPAGGGYNSPPPPPVYGADQPQVPQGTPQYASHQPHDGAGGSPTPSQFPSQPGIIPLRPLGIGQIYEGAFRALRANPAVMFLFSGLLLTIATIIEVALSFRFLTSYATLFDLLESDPQALEILAGDDILNLFVGSFAPLLIGAALSMVASVILTGVLTFAVSQAVLGYRPTVGQVWNQAKGQMLRLIGLVLLVALLTALFIPIVLLIITLSIISDSAVVIGLGIFLSILVSLAWILFVTTATVLATPVLMLERSGPLTALRRSWHLTKTSFWRVLGIYLLTMIIASIVSSVIVTPATFLTLALPTTAGIVAQGVATIIASTVITPFTAAVVALLYIDIRIRREGLASELAAASSQ